MTVVVDASLVAAGLVELGPEGNWAERILDGDDLVAPHLLPAEVVNILRRLVAAGVVASEVAALAQRELLDLPIALYPFEPFATRVWALRDNLTSYDAWYVALAEELRAPVATLDGRMSRSPGTRCTFLTPDA